MSRDVDKLLRLTQKAFEEYVDAGEFSDQDTIDLWVETKAEKSRADAAEAREQKLREGIEEALRDATKWENPYEGYNDLQKLLDSLYPKEETQ